MTDMRRALHGGTAQIHAYLTWRDRMEFFEAPLGGIVDM